MVVFYDGSAYWLADGFHRVGAAREAGLAEIGAEVRQGSLDDAIDYACSAVPNSKHGMREKPEDRRRRVETMIRRKAGWSNVQIAKWCGVSEGTVRSLRNLRSEDKPAERTYTTKHGTTATMRTANIGKPHLRPPPRRRRDGA